MLRAWRQFNELSAAARQAFDHHETRREILPPDRLAEVDALTDPHSTDRITYTFPEDGDISMNDAMALAYRHHVTGQIALTDAELTIVDGLTDPNAGRTLTDKDALFTQEEVRPPSRGSFGLGVFGWAIRMFKDRD